MNELRQHIGRRTGWIARRHKPAVNLVIAFAFLLAQLHPALAAITNDAVANATYVAAPVTSNTSSQAVPVVPSAPGISITKSGVLNDDDGTPGTSAGDTISYTVTVENTGNVSLTNVIVSDPLVPSLAYVSGDADTDNEIDPTETWTYQGSYTLSIGDIATNGGGDGDIDNTVAVLTDETPVETASYAVPLNPNVSMVVTKSGTLNDDDGTPGLSAGDTIDYVIDVENDGSVILTNPVLTDTLTQDGSPLPLALVYDSGDTNSDGNIDPGETWRYVATYTLTQPNIDNGNNLVNQASVNTDQVGPRSDTDTQVLGAPAATYTMTKIAVLNDGDSDGLGDAGETITFTFRFRNVGAVTLANLLPNDPLPGLPAIVCAGDTEPDGDIDTLLPGASADCTATYTITPTDVSNGTVDNVSTSSATRLDGITPVPEDDTANDNATSTPMDRVVELDVDKTVVSSVEVLPNVVEVQYLIELRNTGSTALTNLTLEDDLTSAVSAPASILGTGSASGFTGFTGPGSLNSGYDGVGSNQLFTGDVQLAAGATGEVRITYRIDRRSQGLLTDNVAIATAAEIPGTVPSDDPGETPGDPNDQNPTPYNRPDTDNDGSPDTDESPVADRDGDSIADANDYDPTGYFYCEADGRILSGGLITVENLTLGGSQTGIGSSNDIVILQDGSSGFFQFYVTRAGRYRLVPTLPPSGVASSSRLSSGVLDATTLLPSNPGVIGSGEFGATGVLADFTAGANPFYTEFEIEEGDPTIFNNNIPLAQCGAPVIAVDKQVQSGPTVLPDGRSEITYRFDISNAGGVDIDNLSASDDLASVFGAGNYTIVSLTITSEPAGFGASENPFFDGDGTPSMLTTGGSLAIGEAIAMLLTVQVDVPSGSYTNTVEAAGENSFDSSAIPPVSASVAVNINRPVDADGVTASKTTALASAPIGARVPYTVTFQNGSASPITGADLVDFMPAGFTYLPGSATLNGTATEPVIGDRELVWPGQNIAAGASVTINLSLVVGAAAKGNEFVNSAFIREPTSGELLSNIARAIIRLEIEPVFQCSDIIGRVFDDLDRDGYMDDGEPGLAGVRIASVSGLLITTDQFGRYHVACDQIPDDQIGSNYILKLDERTLPTGYSATSENPRVVRITRGKVAKLNFGAANVRVVRMELTDSSFVGGTTGLTAAALNDVARLLPLLEEERSVLEIEIVSDRPRSTLSRERARAVKQLIEQAWEARSRPHQLEIETRIGR